MDEALISMTKAKCVQVGDEEEISLEGKLVWVGGEDGDSGEMKRLKLLEVRTTRETGLIIVVVKAIYYMSFSPCR